MNDDAHRPPRILVVDDDWINLEVAEEILSAEGFLVETAVSGEQALRQIRDSPPDLVLLDQMMPGLDGRSVCRLLRSDRQFLHLPIIFLTADATRESEIESLRLGADDYVTKPVEPQVLLARVSTHLKLGALRSEEQRSLHLASALEIAVTIRREIEPSLAAATAASALLADHDETLTAEARRHLQSLQAELRQIHGHLSRMAELLDPVLERYRLSD